MISIGWRNLKRDPIRSAVAVLGVTFAVVLVTVEVGMLLGLLRNSSLLVDRSSADLWVATLDVKTFDFATPFDARKQYRIEAIPGVERVEEFNSSYSVWKLPSGGSTNVQVIGVDTRGQLAPKLDLVSGSLDDCQNQDAIIIDEGERAKLGNPNLGDTVEIIQRRAKVVGFTRGMRSFTTTPYVFTSLRGAEHYAWLSRNSMTGGGESGRQVVYLLLRVKPGYDPEAVRDAIMKKVPDVEVHTRSGLSWRTRCYWLIETGVGLGFAVAAFLGLVVGGVIVSQTLYAMTMECLPEFGVLKALGASMPELSRIVLEQSLICGAAGFSLGVLLSLAVCVLAAHAGTSVEIPATLLGCVALITTLLCASSALVSVLRLRSVEPAMVFRA